MKKYIWALIIILILGGVYYYSQNKKVTSENTNNTDSLMCFTYISEGNGIKDLYNLKFDIKGENVNGELNFLPAEKDSKVGEFKGLISPYGEDSSTRIIAAWWDTMGEGIKNREQLAILLKGETASIGFGEMKESGDGSYVYADPSQVSYTLHLQSVDCSSLTQ